jgi:hypothetical protein
MGRISAGIGWNPPLPRRNLLRSFVTPRMPQPADIFIMNVALATAYLKQAQQFQLNAEQSIVKSTKPPIELRQNVPWNGEMQEFYETRGSSRRHWRDRKFRSWSRLDLSSGETDGVRITEG